MCGGSLAGLEEQKCWTRQQQHQRNEQEWPKYAEQSGREWKGGHDRDQENQRARVRHAVQPFRVLVRRRSCHHAGKDQAIGRAGEDRESEQQHRPGNEIVDAAVGYGTQNATCYRKQLGTGSMDNGRNHQHDYSQGCDHEEPVCSREAGRVMCPIHQSTDLEGHR
ncbi:MAG: hypothetical protein KGP14_15060 [Betaproteobacteria bacterium]|nr:hypothetical protein [Betaproteobacteria bacterium]